MPLVYDFFATSALNTCQKFARLGARAKLWHLLGHSGKLLTITKAIEVIFSVLAGSRTAAETAGNERLTTAAAAYNMLNFLLLLLQLPRWY